MFWYRCYCHFPLLFKLPAFYSFFDLSVSGQIGDTINGVAEPFIALLAAILTFLAFYIQYKANEQQKLWMRSEFVQRFYDRVENEISNMSYDGKIGVDAFYAFKFDHTNEGNKIEKFLDSLNYILSNFEMLLRYTEEQSSVNKDIKSQIRNSLFLLFYSKMLWGLKDTMKEKGEWFLNIGHDDSKITIPKFARLSVQCINHLKDENLIVHSPWKVEIIQAFENLADFKTTLNLSEN